MDRLAALRRWYERRKKNIFYIDLVIILLLFYAEPILPPDLIDQLLPGVMIFAAAILFESLFSINEHLLAEIEEREFPDDVFGAADKIKSLVLAQGKKHRLDIIAATGSSNIHAYLLELLRDYPGHLSVSLLLVQPERAEDGDVPDHWREEVRSSIQRVLEAAGRRHDIKVSLYSWTPCITGIMVDNKHLLLGFFSWNARSKKISDQKDHHTYFERSPGTEKWFYIFENWLRCAPQQNYASNERTRQGGRE
jgi:hypothetical protein